MLLGLLLATSSLAFQPATNSYGSEVTWEVMPVRWAYVDDGRPDGLSFEDSHHAIRKAFAEWNAVPGARVQFIEDDGTTPADELNLVYWDDEWAWSADIIAVTSTWSRPKGEIVGFSIGINAEDPVWSVNGEDETMDLQNAITHEVGHALGLGHDPEHADATMAPTASEGETRKRDLHRSDEAGARFLYPGDDEQRVHCSSTQAPPSLLWTLAIGLLTALGTRRRSPSPEQERT